MALLLNYLDYIVAVLERAECILGGLLFLKRELAENPRVEFRQELETYPHLLQVVEAMPMDLEACNCFLCQVGNPLANEALLWCFGRKTAHEQARQYWIKFLESLESLAM